MPSKPTIQLPPRRQVVAALVSVATLGFAADAAAGMFTVEAQLTGDGRPGNPSGLIVDVTIDVTDDVASWLIDINSPMHPDIRLDEFYFNIDGDPSDPGDKFFYDPSNADNNVRFDNFDPSNWTVTSPASPVGGGVFMPNFAFETTDETGNPSNNPTNSVDFTFDMTLIDGTMFDINDFLLAPISMSTDSDLGDGQLGAHLQSLSVDGETCPQQGCSDSGFALGLYTVPPTEPPGPDPREDVPLPGTLFLMGLGTLGMGVARRRRRG